MTERALIPGQRSVHDAAPAHDTLHVEVHSISQRAPARHVTLLLAPTVAWHSPSHSTLPDSPVVTRQEAAPPQSTLHDCAQV